MWRGTLRQSPWLATALAMLVMFQAALGKWTVTMLLKPAIVTAHLLGGMALLAGLVWLAAAQERLAAAPAARTLRAAALLGFAVAAIQVTLGGWVSANYAALACPDLPLCLGEAVPPMDFADAFHVVRELGQTREGALLPREALTAIHWLHRAFALIALAALLWVAHRALRVPAVRGIGIAIAALVVLQFALGVATVAAGHPLALAAAHNAGAAALLAALTVLNFAAFRGQRPQFFASP
jgi:cytochrome c oxidase assembly protein subunit 15